MLTTFYPEMHEVPAGTEVVARLNPYNGKWRLKTSLSLSIKGVTFDRTREDGVNIYDATSKAFAKVCESHNVASEILL